MGRYLQKRKADEPDLDDMPGCRGGTTRAPELEPAQPPPPHRTAPHQFLPARPTPPPPTDPASPTERTSQ